MTAADQKRWVDLRFSVTDKERDEFRLDAAKRKMGPKALFQKVMQLCYSYADPLSERIVPRSRTRSNGERWRGLSFKVSPEERDEFILEAAKQRMNHTVLFQAATQLYRDTYPVPAQ